MLQLTGGRYVVLTIELRVWCRQGTAVEFAVGGQWHAVEQNQVGRHHVVRQLRLEVRLERFTQLRLLLVALPGQVADQIARQLLARRRVQRQHDGFANGFVLQQAGFDFTQLDAEAANLHLMVDTPQVFHQTVGALAHQIAGAI